MATSELKKRLFEVNNARTQSREEVVNTFVPPASFLETAVREKIIFFKALVAPEKRQSYECCPTII